jgi:hypothetical protein
MYGKEINQKKKVLEAKKKAQLKHPKSDTESIFSMEELKGTESRPMGISSPKDQEMVDMMRNLLDLPMKNIDHKFETQDQKYYYPILNVI